MYIKFTIHNLYSLVNAEMRLINHHYLVKVDYFLSFLINREMHTTTNEADGIFFFFAYVFRDVYKFLFESKTCEVNITLPNIIIGKH